MGLMWTFELASYQDDEGLTEEPMSRLSSGERLFCLCGLLYLYCGTSGHLLWNCTVYPQKPQPPSPSKDLSTTSHTTVVSSPMPGMVTRSVHYSAVLYTESAAVSGMVHDEVRETGTEGNMAVIRCPYTEGYDGYSKYFCKGLYRTCETLIKSNGKDVWTYKGRMFLQDDTERKMFVVTIRNLSMEDTGEYGCGIEKLGQDPFTMVHLTVIRALKPPKPIQSTASTTTISTNKALGRNVPLTVSTAKPYLVTNFLSHTSPSETVDHHQPERPVTGSAEDGPDYENDPPRNHNPVARNQDYQNTNQSDSVYQSLNPNTNQSDSVYQSLNHNTNQSDSVYQSLNPNTNQSDSLYQGVLKLAPTVIKTPEY
ncbi:hypothetical protein NFI96_008377 [Prochilodus magdalenae]|nr:hypothetical protein NFI96_008377 [Prochilodus magdalenae]